MAELLTIDREIAQAISEGAGRAQLEALAERAGFRSMIEAREGEVMCGERQLRQWSGLGRPASSAFKRTAIMSGLQSG